MNLAKKRFSQEPKVKIVQGNSGDKLPQIISKLDQPTIFWLDAHYSGRDTSRGKKDCPIVEELPHILSLRIPKVILIDDARYFAGKKKFSHLVGKPDYLTLRDLKVFIHKYDSSLKFEVFGDIIRIY